MLAANWLWDDLVVESRILAQRVLHNILHCLEQIIKKEAYARTKLDLLPCLSCYQTLFSPWWHAFALKELSHVFINSKACHRPITGLSFSLSPTSPPSPLIPLTTSTCIIYSLAICKAKLCDRNNKGNHIRSFLISE